MHITLLKLEGYKRLMRSGIKSFEWTPTKQLMVMVGSNGSGKSSVLEELSPLPAKHKGFIKGGVKEFHCYHKGSQYQLRSVYDHGTGRHSFIRDDEELNSGGTFKIQEDLCTQEFDLTREYQDILTGRIQFTDMSTAERRKILTKMSVVNLDYAFSTFDRLKVESRSQKGTVDTITKRLVTENHDIPTDAEMDLMRKSNKVLNERLNRLFTARQPQVTRGFNTEAEATLQLERLIERAKTVLYQYPKLPAAMVYTDHATFLQEKQLVAEQCSAITAVINRMAEELESLRGTNTADLEVSPEQIALLSTKVHDLEVALQLETSAFKAIPVGVLPIVTNLDLSNNPAERLDGLFNRLMHSLNAFPNNETGYLSRASYNGVLQNIQTNIHKRRELDSAYQTASQRLSRLKACDSVVCVKCDHEFKPGVDESEGPKLEQYISNCSDSMDSLDLAIKADEEYIDAFKEYQVHVNNYAAINAEYSEYSDLWDSIASTQLVFRTPKQLVQMLVEWHTAMRCYLSLRNNTEYLLTQQRRLATMKEIDSDAVAYTRKRGIELEHEIATYYQSQAETNALYQAICSGERSITELTNELQTIISEYDEWHTKAMAHTEWLLDKAFESEITETQLQLAEGTRRLNLSEQREHGIRVLENEVNTAKESASDINLVIKALSPNGGLLGKYLMGFMQGVVSYVNAYIGEVWTYSMEVMPSRMDRDELDYNFPLNISDGAVVADDISLGSDSQLEMVNFSFCQAMRKFLGLEDFPLFLDEFGRTFDEQHRANLIPFISRLIENGQHKQIFYISHEPNLHAAFSHTEYMVLDPLNITVPMTYNKNVVIK